MSKALATKKVAAALLGFGMVLAIAGTASAQTTTSNSSTLATLQAQVQALLAQIAALQGTGTATTGTTSGGACFTFSQNLHVGSSGQQVQWVQEFLNSHGFQIAATGAGSPGNESMYYGSLTAAAVSKFQEKYAAQVLTPEGLTKGTGNWYTGTRAEANSVCAGSTGTGTGTTGTTTGGGVTVTAGTQPANSLAPENASRVPFTTFTLTNNSGAAVTINGITIQRTGLANDDAFAGVILLDSNGLQYGNSQTFNSNHQATIGGTFTLNVGQSVTYTVAGNMTSDETDNAGQVASISVVGVNTSVPVTGSLPITGAQQTVNSSLTIGTATVSLSGYDPDSQRSESIGTTGLTFSGIHITAGSAEDMKLYSITWNQTGSVGSTDLSNLVTVVNGTSYPVTADSSGKYYTATFPGGILISKGNSVDAYIQGDITGSDASGRTVEFDIYRASDIYVVGQTYGYGITPTTTLTGTNNSGANTSSGGSNTSNPFYWGTEMSITGGTLSTVSSASNVAPQNIAVNVSGQVLGGFSTNFTGEPVTVQSLTVHVASSTAGVQLQNVTLVDQNGNVVAGPVDETDSTATIKFNSSITFPTGAMTYTIKGTVASLEDGGNTPTPDNMTYTLSTNPNTDWASAVGQTSGTYVSLPSTTITMSTMTVQSGSLTVSASASPTSQTITSNQNNFTLANIVLDASASGEDVRLNSLPIVISGSSTDATLSSNPANLQSNLTNCQLYNGNTVLNNQSIGTSQWGVKTDLGNTNTGLTGGHNGTDGIEANFVFTNSLTVPKGTTVTLSLQCNIGGSVVGGEQFAAGVSNNNTSYEPTVTGANSGNSITPTVNIGTSGIMTVGTASMTVSTPTQSYQVAAAGTTGVTVGSFTLQPTTGNVTLQNITLKLNSNYASSSDLQNGVVTVWNGQTQVGTVSFNGLSANNGVYTSATTTLSSNVTLAQNQITTFTLKADLAAIGSNGSSGHEILVGLNDVHGTAGNSVVDSGPGAMPAQKSGVAVFKGFPTVSQYSLATTGNADGNMIEFSVTASQQGNGIGIGQLNFAISSSTGVTVTSPALYYGTSVSPSTEALNNGSNAATCTSSKCTVDLATPIQISAGQTMYFLLKAQSLSYTGSSNTYSITTTLSGDTTTDLSPSTVASSTLSADNFVWTPYSTTTLNSAASNDWSNGYQIPGLGTGFSQSRSN